METRDPGFPGEFGRNRTEQQEEQRFGEEAHAYNRGRSAAPQPGEQLRTDERGRGEAWLAQDQRVGSLEADTDTPLDSGTRTELQDDQGGMATSSALVSTRTAAGAERADGAPTAGTQQVGDTGAAARGHGGTGNSDRLIDLSSESTAGGLIGAGVSDDAAWQRDRSGFQEHFTARHPSADEAAARRTWDQAEPNYRYGYEAARNEQYQGRTFADSEPELRRDYEQRPGASGLDQEGGWERLREEVREGFERFRAI